MPIIRKEDRRHLFLRLYESDITQIPLSHRILDFDKSIPLRFYKYGDMSRITERHFRNLDEVFLEHKAVSAVFFCLRFLLSLEHYDLKIPISLQHLFELSMLIDRDKKPSKTKPYKISNEEVAGGYPIGELFEKAYINDAKRYEIDILSNYYRLMVWYILKPADLEFSRRVQESLYYYSTWSGLKIGHGDITYKSAFVDQDYRMGWLYKESDVKKRSDEMNDRLYTIEENLLHKLSSILGSVPKNMYFDGSRFIFLLEDTVTKPMLEVIDNPREVITNEHRRIYPTDLYASYDDIRQSLSSKISIVNAMTDHWASKDTKALDWVRALMYDCDENQSITKILKSYNENRLSIVKEYMDVIDAKTEFLYKFLRHAPNNRKVFVLMRTNNGYVVALYSGKQRGSMLRRIQSEGYVYDQDCNLLYKTSYWNEYQPQRKDLKGVIDRSMSDTEAKERQWEEIMEEHSRRLMYGKSVIAIDYAAESFDQQIKRYVTLFKNNNSHISAFSNPLQLALINLTRIYEANSLYSYVGELKTQIKTNGYANIKNYNRVVQMYQKGFSEQWMYSNSRDYSKYGAKTSHGLERKTLNFVSSSGRVLDTSLYTAATKHIEFGDIDYETVDTLPEYQHRVKEIEEDWHERIKIEKL